MQIVPVQLTNALLDKYCSLFKTCFPHAHHYSNKYLLWLYGENPAGEVVGFDAFDGHALAAHYVCIPIKVVLHGENKRALLSLDTATHPSYQGRGLFTTLAKLTYELASDQGYECVIGISNANSTPGLVKNLGFQLVGTLEARIGFGTLGVTDWDEVIRRACLRRFWDQELIAWRIRNPSNPIHIGTLSEGVSCAWTATHYRGIVAPGISAWAEIPISLSSAAERCLPWIAPRLFIGMVPSELCDYPAHWNIPDFLKPVPLNFIYRNLQHHIKPLHPNQCLINFLDFDAY